jgi:hypothetical protein
LLASLNAEQAPPTEPPHILRSPLDRLHLCWTPTDSFVNMGAWQRLTDGAWIIKLWNICG